TPENYVTSRHGLMPLGLTARNSRKNYVTLVTALRRLDLRHGTASDRDARADPGAGCPSRGRGAGEFGVLEPDLPAVGTGVPSAQAPLIKAGNGEGPPNEGGKGSARSPRLRFAYTLLVATVTSDSHAREVPYEYQTCKG